MRPTTQDGPLDEIPGEAGKIVTLQYLGRIDRTSRGKEHYAAAAFFLRYQSVAEIAALLFVPIGQPPPDGWPVSVWSHGLDDPAIDFYSWPFEGSAWGKVRGVLPGSWANSGMVTLTPWMPGMGPSQPFGSYSPLSLDRHAQVCIDGFLALRQLEKSFAKSFDVTALSSITPSFDHTRQVFRAECVSTPLIASLARQREELPALAGLKGFVADLFMYGFAHHAAYLGPSLAMLPAHDSACWWRLYAYILWGVAEEQGWPQTKFLSESAVRLLSEKVVTPAGITNRLRGCRQLPYAKNELAPIVVETVSAEAGRNPTGLQVRDWLFSEQTCRWLDLANLEQMIQDRFYTNDFAALDPFVPGSVSPVASGIPLLVIGAASDIEPQPGTPTLAERFEKMAMPKVALLRSWGWDVRVFRDDEKTGTSYSHAGAQRWAMGELQDIFHPGSA
jgi:hypothetical protein